MPLFKRGSAQGPSQDGAPKFQSLVERSIAAWRQMQRVGAHAGIEERQEHTQANIQYIRGYASLDALLRERRFWFFQKREYFCRQTGFKKWNDADLDEYILVPIDVGFANALDCWFVSHFWRTQSHPDPRGEDFRMVKSDLEDRDWWKYVWVDWTCVPQKPRTESQAVYFGKILETIPMLVRDCAFEWRYPPFEPRAWILFEICECMWTSPDPDMIRQEGDVAQYVQHINEMGRVGVFSVLQKYRYRCTNQTDMKVLRGNLELLLILKKLGLDIFTVRDVLTSVNKTEFRDKISYYRPGAPKITVSKVEGYVETPRGINRFTPIEGVVKLPPHDN